MKKMNKGIAIFLITLMVFTITQTTAVFGVQNHGMTQQEFKQEITLRMQTFYENMTEEQETILRTFGDSLKTSSLSPYVVIDASWDNVLSDLMNSTYVANYASSAEAKAVLAKAIYSTLELIFYLNNDTGTDVQKLDAAVDNAYINAYAPIDSLFGAVITKHALSDLLNGIQDKISNGLLNYATAVLDAMNANSSTIYVNTIVNRIASVGMIDLFDAASGPLLTIKNRAFTNAGFASSDLGTFVKKIYEGAALIETTQKAPSVQFNILINQIIKFHGVQKDTSDIINFDQSIILNSKTEDEVVFAINPNQVIDGIDLNMTQYFVVSSPNVNIISATKIEDTEFGGFYIKLKAMPNVGNDGTYYVHVYRKSVAGENYFFNIKVDVKSAVDKSALQTAIASATALMNSKTVGKKAGDVTQSSKDALQSAISTATAVYSNANTTEIQVIHAGNALTIAITNFNNSIIVNVAPVANNITGRMLAFGEYTGTFDATDENGDTLTYEIISQSSGLNVGKIPTGFDCWIPLQLPGVYTFDYKANDGTLDSNTATATITVKSTNEPPITSVTVISFAAPLNGLMSGVLPAAIDLDLGDPIIYAIGSAPAHGTLRLNSNGTYTFTPDFGYTGTDTFTYRVFDGIAYSDPVTVTFTVFSNSYDGGGGFPSETIKSTNASIPKDMAGHWANKDIQELATLLAGKGVTLGDEQGMFNPDKSMTRAEMVTLFIKAIYGDAVGKETSKFIDSRYHWADPYIAKAVSIGIVNGMTDTEFAPDVAVTREQAMSIIARFLGITSTTLNGTITDKESISTWAASNLYAMFNEGFIKGYEDNTIRPLNNITKAEFATMLNRMKDKLTIK